ncbi:MAG: hypothetical protein R3C16_12715 [Hyphomonadaceae bacterium]
MIAALLVQIIALALIVGAVAAAVAAVGARSMFASVMALVVAAALAGAAILALGAGDAALAVFLFAVAIAPMWLLGAVLLTGRAAKPRRGRRPWLSLAAAIIVAALVMWGGGELDVSTPLPGDAALPFWLAPLAFVAAIACFGLLGFGERGALEPHERMR